MHAGHPAHARQSSVLLFSHTCGHRDLDLTPSYSLCDLGLVMHTFWASVIGSVKWENKDGNLGEEVRWGPCVTGVHVARSLAGRGQLVQASPLALRRPGRLFPSPHPQPALDPRHQQDRVGSCLPTWRGPVTWPPVLGEVRTQWGYLCFRGSSAQR